MTKNEDIEKVLLSGQAYDEIIKEKIENEFLAVINHSQPIKAKYITEINAVPKDKLFSKAAVYEVINKISKTRSYINGIQAEAYLAGKNIEREKLISGEIEAFVSGDSYIKFIKIKI